MPFGTQEIRYLVTHDISPFTLGNNITVLLGLRYQDLAMDIIIFFQNFGTSVLHLELLGYNFQQGLSLIHAR